MTDRTKRIIRIIIGLLAIIVVGIGGTHGYLLIKESTKAVRIDEEERPVPVKVVFVEKEVIEQVLVITGNVEPQFAVEIVPKISGRLERLTLKDGTPVDIGVKVKKGEVIAEIDRAAFVARVTQAEAAVSVARASLAKAEADLADKEKEKERTVRLFEEGAGTERQRDKAVADYDRALASRSLAAAQIEQAVASLEAVTVDLGETYLKATISGVVTRKYMDEGSMVGPGVPVVRIINLDKIKIMADIPGLYQELLVLGKTEVEVKFEGLRDKFHAKISKISEEHRASTRTIPVEIWMDNKRKDDEASGVYLIQAGMYATVRLTLKRHEDAVVIPSDTLIRRGGKHYVFLADDHQARRVEVTTGIRSADRVEVLSGLNEGDRLVVTGQQRLTHGAAIDVLKNGNGHEK